MSYDTYSSQRYIETAILTASPEQRVVLLYEQAIRSLKQAAVYIEQKDLEGKRRSLDNVLGVLQHLQTSLDMRQGGEIAVELRRIYQYISNKVLEASVQLKTDPLQEAVQLLSTLLESWQNIASPTEKGANLMPARMVG
jgi:flagellar protein FliS